MRNQFNKRSWKYLVAGLLALSVTMAFPCSVPVFRYALEHWPADPYEAVIFHRGPLTKAQREIAELLAPEGLAGRLNANLKLLLVDLDQALPEDLAELWGRQNSPALPAMLLRYPSVLRIEQAAWSGPLSEVAARRILESPARRDIGSRLLKGESAVWVLLESGGKAEDDAAATRLETRLAYLRQHLKLPVIEAEDISKGLVTVAPEELKVAFSIVRLSRSDPAEEAFAQMLLGTEADLAALKEPIAFPVFGRGRVLYALVGKGINDENVDETGAFLIGPCSCQVKELNPGSDLLMAVNWEGILRTGTGPSVEAPAGATR